MTAERRIYPRVHTRIPAELSSSVGEMVDVTLINLSLGGMLVEGGAAMAALKAPIGGTPLEVNLHFGLKDQPLHCQCRVVYNQRQSQNCLRFGLAILSIDDQAKAVLQAYIQERLS